MNNQEICPECGLGSTGQTTAHYESCTNVPYNQRDHVHCFDQENPPCGIKLKDHKQCCLCELPMTTNDWEKKIREICTYSGDEGTSGYLLSEEQFEKIFSLFRSERSSVRRETVAEIRKFLEESSVWSADYIYLRKALMLQQFDEKFTNLDTISHE